MVQSVERTLNIVEALASADEDVSLSRLHEKLGLSLPTLHRLLATLICRGYAVQDKDTRRYGPGPKLLEIAASATSNSRFSLRRMARSYLHELTVETGETSNLVVPRGDEAVYVEQAVSSRLVRMFTEVGHRAPLYCTGSGKAILSHLLPLELDAYLAREQLRQWTPHTITSPDQLRQDIARTQQRGFAIDDQEREEGVCCVASVVLDHSGVCVAAISISGPTTRVSLQRAHDLGPRVRQAAEACSRQLGYRAPSPVPDIVRAS